MANVNLTTGKVYGANKGTLKYYHEVGHLKFEDSKDGNIIRIGQDLSFKTLVFVTAFQAMYSNEWLKGIIVVMLILSIIFEVTEEVWCWQYAQKKYKVINVQKNKN